MLEAECTKCKGTFIPHSEAPEDLVHLWDEEKGKICGGDGIILGEWVSPIVFLTNDGC